MTLMLNRLGEVNYNNRKGTKMIIIKYNSSTDVTVEFQDEFKFKRHTSYAKFKKGNVGNPYDRTVFDVGYFGVGKYNSKKHKNAYKAWCSMIERCYSKKFQDKHKNYINHTVCDEWHNFQNFAEWYEINYYEVPNERIEVENNILMKGNTEYCPEYSILSPQRINTLFVKMFNSLDRGDCCIGVTWNKRIGKFISQISYIDKNGNYKRMSKGFSTEEDAFLFYKNFKENYIKQVADEYYDLIPRELWKAMYEYEIEITD